jgi:hypothetical protein
MRAILVDEPIALHQGIQTQQRRQIAAPPPLCSPICQYFMRKLLKI